METPLYQEARTLERFIRRGLFPLPFSERRLVLRALDLLAVNGARFWCQIREKI